MTNPRMNSMVKFCQGDDQDLDDRVIRQLWEDNKELREEVQVCFWFNIINTTMPLSLLSSFFVDHPLDTIVTQYHYSQTKVTQLRKNTGDDADEGD